MYKVQGSNPESKIPTQKSNPSLAHEANKDINWDAFTKDWNDDVNDQDVGQPVPVTDSNKHIYFIMKSLSSWNTITKRDCSGQPHKPHF
jgi:hypothetical protein